jgi:hypothetical protein
MKMFRKFRRPGPVGRLSLGGSLEIIFGGPSAAANFFCGSQLNSHVEPALIRTNQSTKNDVSSSIFK